MPPNQMSHSASSGSGSASNSDPPAPASRNGNQIKRLASKPLKLAASTFRPLTRSSSTSAVPPASVDATLYTEGAGNGVGSGSVRSLGLKKKRRHLKSKDGATLTPAQLASAARGPRKPLEGEEPAAWLRVRVVKADNLVAKDRNGTSDPFISLLLPPSTRHNTPVIKKSLNPSFPSDGSTFDFPIYLSLGGVVGSRGLEGVVWDKDLMKKEYMGEVTIPLSQWFPSGEVELWSENLPLLNRKLLSTRRTQNVSGTLSLQIGFLEPKTATGPEDALNRVKMVYEALREQANVGRDYLGVLGVPAHEGIGTVQMRSRRKDGATDTQSGGAPASLPATSMSTRFSPFSRSKRQTSPEDLEYGDGEDSDADTLNDDGLSSETSEDEFESGAEDEDALSTLHESPMLMEDTIQTVYNATVGLPPPPKTKTSESKSGGWLGAKTLKSARQSSVSSEVDDDQFDSPGMSVPSTPGTGLVTPGGTKAKRPIFKRNKSRAPSKKSSRMDFNFDANSAADVQGIVVMEIQSASDLPKLKNALRLSFDMDPFVVISFGKKVFRTRVIRHQLNPVWDEKLLFHVRRNENAYTIQFAVLDWDKVSGNDMVGSCTLPLNDLMDDAPHPDPETGLYAAHEDGKHESKTFTLPISTEKEMPWESKHSPHLTVRAKYEPYDALRQKFWRQYASQYDVDETGKISHTELSAMLDSLGSTLTHQTIESFFSRFGKSSDSDELTLDEVVRCMEREVNKSKSERAKVSTDDSATSGSQTPNMAPEPAVQGLDASGPEQTVSSPVDADELRDKILKSVPQDRTDGKAGPGNLQPLDTGSSLDVPEVKLERPATVIEGQNEIPQMDGAISPSSGLSENDDSESTPDDRERVINIRSCPLCHRRRLKRKSEQDIITHLAICASSDWSRMDRIVTSNYVTSSQAQRKFFTKLIGKVTAGAYSLGANSANILVQDRRTGQLQEEKMAVYVRLGIRVLYKGARGGMASSRAKRLLKSLSVKQGIKYDSPESAADILPFIAFHALNIEEILDPLDSFKTFNEFFYRKLKPSARPVSEPENESRMVSCADCRMMAFDTVTSATSIWIKGRDFSVAKLLGPNYKDVVDRYEGGALGIFRLAPQDYHRFHSPVSGTVGKMTMIGGEYYTVNPQAIRTSLDVYGENARKVVPIQSDDFGLVMTVWVGAMMVGSILTSVEEGQKVARADELGYFAFGGSTIVLLFERGALEWDEDLLANGRASIETLVRVGMGIGRKKGTEPSPSVASSAPVPAPAATTAPVPASAA